MIHCPVLLSNMPWAVPVIGIAEEAFKAMTPETTIVSENDCSKETKLRQPTENAEPDYYGKRHDPQILPDHVATIDLRDKDRGTVINDEQCDKT